MQNNDIEIAVKFLLNSNEVQVTDNTDYAGESITPSKVAGIITAKRANTVFHSTTDYDTPDISPGTSLVDTFDGPSNKLPESIYSVKYSIRVFDEVLGSSQAGSMPSSTSVVFPSSNVAAQLNQLIADAEQVAIAIYDGGLLLGIRNVTGQFSFGGGNISVAVEALASFASADSFSVVTYYTKTYTYNFCNTLPKVNIEAFADCLRAQITVNDKTVWPAGYNVSNHKIKLQFPNDIDGTPVAAAVETEDYSLLVGPNIYSGGYNIAVSADVLYTQDDGLVVEGAVIGNVYPNVQCDTTLCCVRECLDELHDKYLVAIQKGSNQTASLFQQIFNIQIFLTRYQLAVDCQATYEASSILQQLKDYMSSCGTKCNCGCSEADGKPEVITPLYSA